MNPTIGGSTPPQVQTFSWIEKEYAVTRAQMLTLIHIYIYIDMVACGLCVVPGDLLFDLFYEIL